MSFNRLVHGLATSQSPFFWAWFTISTLFSICMIVGGLMLLRPAAYALASAAPGGSAPLIPADFTPLASPPPAFSTPTPTLVPTESPAVVSIDPIAEQVLPTATEAPAVPPTTTPIPLDAILQEQSEGSRLAEARWLSILLLGTDARAEEGGPSRTDSLMVVVLDLESGSATVISVPRDLWVFIPGYGEGRINTAYFLGELWSDGPTLAAQTVSQALGIPINHTAVINFDGFRKLVDSVGGIDIDVPVAIDDPLYPDDSYGTFRLVIPAGEQHMDGQRALQYARTRHGSSDIERGARQQAVMQAIRERLLTPEHLPHLPRYIVEAANAAQTDLSVSDLFFLARFGRNLESDRIHQHVINSPLLWNGLTADGQQVLLYDPYTLQQAVQGWLYEASEEPTTP